MNKIVLAFFVVCILSSPAQAGLRTPLQKVKQIALLGPRCVKLVLDNAKDVAYTAWNWDCINGYRGHFL